MRWGEAALAHPPIKEVAGPELREDACAGRVVDLEARADGAGGDEAHAQGGGRGADHGGGGDCAGAAEAKAQSESSAKQKARVIIRRLLTWRAGKSRSRFGLNGAAPPVLPGSGDGASWRERRS